MADQQEQTYEPLAVPVKNMAPFRFEISEGDVIDFFEVKSKEYLNEAYGNILTLAKKPEQEETVDDFKFRRKQFNYNKRKVKDFWYFITCNWSMHEIKQNNFWEGIDHAFISSWYQRYLDYYFGVSYCTSQGKRNPILVAIESDIYLKDNSDEKIQKLKENNFLEDLWDAQGIPYLYSIHLEK